MSAASKACRQQVKHVSAERLVKEEILNPSSCWISDAVVCWRMLTHADICWHADVCWRMLTYHDVKKEEILNPSSCWISWISGSKACQELPKDVSRRRRHTSAYAAASCQHNVSILSGNPESFISLNPRQAWLLFGAFFQLRRRISLKRDHHPPRAFRL